MNIIDISLTLSSLIMAIISYIIIKGENNRRNKVFSLFVLSISLWSWGILFFRISSSINSTLVFSSFNYIIANLIVTFFLHFSYLFPKEQKDVRIYIIYLVPITLTIALAIEPNLILKEIVQLEHTKVVSVNILSYILYSVYFLLVVIIAYIKLFRSYYSTKEFGERVQLRLIIAGTIFPYIIAIFFDLILPTINYSYVWIGPLLGFVVASILVYAIYKHDLLKAKIITAEFFTILLWIFIIIRILLSNDDKEKVINIMLLVFTIIFGILLIKSVLNESRQRVLLEKINSTLEQRVSEQTAEVKKAFELEKKARRELEKLNETKDQFIIMAQHHLRSPVNNISNEVSKMLIDSGNGDERYTLSFNRMKDWVARLSRIVDDFLGIASLKVGSNILNVSDMRITPIIDDILDELRIDIENMKVFVNYQRDDIYWPIIKVDSNKIREAILIVIENAVRYNRVGGRIDINTKINHDTFEMDFVNTGVGITYEEKSKLFSKPFFRGGRAKANHPIGMGVGLTIARAIIKGHHGDINISSDGEDMGAKVSINIPLDFIKQMKAIG